MGLGASGGSGSDKKYPSINLSGVVLDNKCQAFDIFYPNKHGIG
jgi:hypothetical protein